MNRTDEIDRIFSNIGKIRDKIDFMLNIIQNNQKIDKDNLFLKTYNNIGSSLNDKVVEISNYFKDHDTDFYNESILKYIIENDLMIIANNALNIMSKYLLELNIYFEDRLKNSNFLGIRSKKQKKIDREKILDMNQILSEYEVLNDKILKYNFTDNVVDNIMDFIDRNGYEWYKNNIGTIESIEDELDNLGLNNLVFKLEKMVKEKGYIDILPNNNFDTNKNNSVDSLLNKDDIVVLNVSSKDLINDRILNLKNYKKQFIGINENSDEVKKKVA